MKNLIFIICFVISHSSIVAQKEDFEWIMGYEADFQAPGTNNIVIGFNENKLSINYVNKNIEFLGTNASICDSTGRLLLYSNGCVIKGASGDTLPNGDSLNVDYAFVEFCVNQGGYRSHDMAIFLPVPSNYMKFILLHVGQRFSVCKKS